MYVCTYLCKRLKRLVADAAVRLPNHYCSGSPSQAAVLQTSGVKCAAHGSPVTSWFCASMPRSPPACRLGPERSSIHTVAARTTCWREVPRSSLWRVGDRPVHRLACGDPLRTLERALGHEHSLGREHLAQLLHANRHGR